MRRFTEGDEQTDLADQFLDPLSLVTAKSASSVSEADQLFARWEAALVQKDDWKARMTALQDAMSYLKGGGPGLTDANFSSLATGVGLCVTDLRSALVRWGSLYTAACAHTLGASFVGSTEIIVPALFKQLTHGTAVIANSCKYALLEVGRHVQHRRTARTFLAQQSSRSNAHRQVVVEFVQTAMECWPPALITSLKDQFTTLLKTFSEDPSPVVRKIAKELLQSPPKSRAQTSMGARPPLTPAKQKLASLQIPQAIPRAPLSARRKGKNGEDIRLNKSVRASQIPMSPKMARAVRQQLPLADGQPMTEPLSKSASLIEAEGESSTRFPLPPSVSDLTSKDIDEYMPPRSARDAEKFLKLLGEITKAEEFERLDGLDVLLPPAMVSATQFIPDIKRWHGVFPVLFRQFPDVFLDQLESLLVGFSFHEWLVKLAVTSLGEKGVIEKAIGFSDENAFRFFVVLLNKARIKPALTDKLRRRLSELAKLNFDDRHIEVVNEFLNPGENADNIKVVADLKNALMRGHEDLVPLFEALSNEFGKGDEKHAKAIERSMTPILEHALEKGNREANIVIIDFCTSAMTATHMLLFKGLVPSILNLLIDKDSSVIDLAAECVSTMLECKHTFAIELMEMVDGMLRDNTDQALAVLAILHKFFEDLPEEEMINYADPLMEFLQLAFSSDVTSIRRVIVTIFVEFRCKVPDEFEPYMQKLHSTQQKLIELYSSKRSPKQ